MIKINLLDSITDTPTGAAMMEERVAGPGMQTLLLALVVAGLLFLGAGYDYASSRSAHAAAERDLEVQQRINREMLAVNKEQEELQNKTRDIQVRIDAIQKLKASQQGPSLVLREIKARFDNAPGLYLKSIEQKGNDLVIKGEAPCGSLTPGVCEAAVTRFGQSLEFSSGLFSELHIETLRELAKVEASKNAVAVDAEALKPEVVSFTVRCTYNAPKPAQPAPGNTAVPANGTVPANQLAKN